MKKTITLSLVTLITLAVMVANALAAQPAAAAAKAAGADAAQAAALRAALVQALPAEVSVPAELPAGIQDAMLLEAWVRLYNHTDAIELYDGTKITGRALALYARVSDIPVVFDAEGVCGGGSCSRHSCESGKDVCDFEADGLPGQDPIYIKLQAQPFGAGMEDLVSTLAHEIYHRTQPFGGVRDTRYEEYWAYFVGEKISGATTIDFGSYDPRDAGHLNLWIKANRLDGYFKLPEYPAAVAAEIAAEQSAAQAAVLTDNYSGVPAEAYGVQP